MALNTTKDKNWKYSKLINEAQKGNINLEKVEDANRKERSFKHSRSTVQTDKQQIAILKGKWDKLLRITKKYYSERPA